MSLAPLLIVLVAVLHAAPVICEQQEPGQAQYLIRAGDDYTAQGELSLAAAAYARALELERGSLNLDTRLYLIERLAWTELLDLALAEGARLVDDYPHSIKARLQYAEHLSWAGQELEAIIQADRVLLLEPGSTRALLIKANAARWRGTPGRASVLYQKYLLKHGESFPANLGLAYSLLEEGHVAAAAQQRSLLRSSNDREHAEMLEFDQQLRWHEDPSYHAGIGYYYDTDDNDRTELSTALQIPWYNTSWRITAAAVQAEDPVRSLDANLLQLQGSSPLAPALSGLGRVGVVDIEDGSSHFVGAAELSAQLDQWILVGRLEREALLDTAQILSNQIVINGLFSKAAYAYSDRLRPQMQLWFRDYSDDNQSLRARFDLPYALQLVAPRLQVGYRQEYNGFDRQSGGGYFDPSELHSFQGFLAVSHYTANAGGYAELFAGRQKSRRFDSTAYDNLAGFYGHVDFALLPNFRIGLETEGGNYALNTASGFEYYRFLLFVRGLF